MIPHLLVLYQHWIGSLGRRVLLLGARVGGFVLDLRLRSKEAVAHMSANNGSMSMISIATVMAILTSRAVAQRQRVEAPEGPKFEVASVKVNPRGGGPYMQASPGRLTLTYYSVQELVALAFGLRADQVVGKTLTDRYDIVATSAGDTPLDQMVGPMLQNFLATYFKLSLFSESRQLPVYLLTASRNGVKIKITQNGGCTPVTPNAAPQPRSAPGQGPAPVVFFCDHPRTGAKGFERTLEGKGISMEALASSLSRTELNRSVLDKTGLAGRFDVRLKWSVDPTVPGLNDDKGGIFPLADNAGPTIFVALQEQLGLRLQAGVGPVDVLVIDHVERPAQN